MVIRKLIFVQVDKGRKSSTVSSLARRSGTIRTTSCGDKLLPTGGHDGGIQVILDRLLYYVKTTQADNVFFSINKKCMNFSRLNRRYSLSDRKLISPKLQFRLTICLAKSANRLDFNNFRIIQKAQNCTALISSSLPLFKYRTSRFIYRTSR